MVKCENGRRRRRSRIRSGGIGEVWNVEAGKLRKCGVGELGSEE